MNAAAKIFQYEKSVDLVVFGAESWEIPPLLSLSAFTVGRVSRIDFKICFSRANILNILQVELPLTLYHEFSHVTRTQHLGYGETLLDRLIDEGIGCFVEQSSLPGRKIPYIQKIAGEKMLWKKTVRLFDSKEYNYSEWFFGTGKLPAWIGYRFGYLVIQNFMKKNPVSLADLVRTPSKEIIRNSSLPTAGV